MKRIILMGALIASLFLVKAQGKISAMPAVNELDTNAYFPLIQGVPFVNYRANISVIGNALSGSFWGTSGNSGTNPSTNFIGTTDNVDFYLQRNGINQMLCSANSGKPTVIIGDADLAYNNTSITIADYIRRIVLKADSFEFHNTTANDIIFTISSIDTSVNVYGNIKIVDGTQGAGKVLTSDANGLCSFVALSASDYSGIPAYANNAAAVAAIGANKLYYTDVAGEYVLKLSH